MLFHYLLRMADTDLILSQRLGEWCGHGPVLEEDIAVTNVALDLLGQARLWYAYAAEVEGKGRTEDDLAYFRDATEFRNLLLVEQPNGDFGVTMARQFYFDAWHVEVLRALGKSADARIGGIAAKARKEALYHLERSTDWVIRLGDGTEESHRRMQPAVDSLWRYTGEMFEMDELDREMLSGGIGADLAALFPPWVARITQVFKEATLDMPQPIWMQTGGKRGQHTEKLGYILAEMQHLQRTYPRCTW
jgi:ring-1,2-phenylacetyl-CoA epoxidase subunit PaaC